MLIKQSISLHFNQSINRKSSPSKRKKTYHVIIAIFNSFLFPLSNSLTFCNAYTIPTTILNIITLLITRLAVITPQTHALSISTNDLKLHQFLLSTQTMTIAFFLVVALTITEFSKISGNEKNSLK